MLEQTPRVTLFIPREKGREEWPHPFLPHPNLLLEYSIDNSSSRVEEITTILNLKYGHYVRKRVSYVETIHVSHVVWQHDAGGVTQ